MGLQVFTGWARPLNPSWECKWEGKQLCASYAMKKHNRSSREAQHFLDSEQNAGVRVVSPEVEDARKHVFTRLRADASGNFCIGLRESRRNKLTGGIGRQGTEIILPWYVFWEEANWNIKKNGIGMHILTVFCSHRMSDLSKVASHGVFLVTKWSSSTPKNHFGKLITKIFEE